MSTFLKINKYQLKALSLLYFGVVLYFTFFMPRRYEVIDFRALLNLKPFVKLNADILHSMRFESEVNLFVDIVGNILLFVPFPLALCIVMDKELALIWILIVVLAATTSIEIFQYLFNRGVADIDDVFLNFLGGAAGLVLVNRIYKN